MRKLLSKFFRVAREGDTIDGREITRQQIQQMAKNYNTATYGARVWLEHFRGLLPGGPFDALGDVVALQAKEENGKMGLYAQLAPLPALVTMNQNGQKLFSSIEIVPNFAKTDEAYLVGLAVTDSPASLGTERLAFSAGGTNVMAGPAQEISLEFDPEEEDKPSLFARVSEMLSKNKGENNKRLNDLEQAIETVATYAQDLETRLPGESVPRAEYDQLKQAHDTLANDFKALSDKLSATPAPAQDPARPPATGGNGLIATDC